MSPADDQHPLHGVLARLPAAVTGIALVVVAVALNERGRVEPVPASA